MAMRGWPQMANSSVGDSGRILVSGLRSQPKIKIGRNAASCEGTWREVSICQLQEREYTSLVGMHIRTSLERMCSQREAWIAQEGQLVQGMLQLASKISWKTQH
jgi:hypothetical protein